MNKIQSVAEVTTWDGRRTLIVRLAPGAKASFINGAFYLDEPTIEDYRRLKNGSERAVMGPVRDAEFGNDPPYSTTREVEKAWGEHLAKVQAQTEAEANELIDRKFGGAVVLPRYTKAG